MARIRSIKPEFFTSEQLAECSTSARLLFVGLWVFSDDNGVHPASVVRLKMEVFPGDAISPTEMQTMMNELIALKLVKTFTRDGETFWHIPSWRKHQKIDKPTYRYPIPPIDDASSNGTPQNSIPRRELDESSSNGRRDLGHGMERRGVEGKGEETKGVESKGREPSRVDPKSNPTQKSSPSSAQGAQQPVRSSTGEPVSWAEVAEAMKPLKISRKAEAMKFAQEHGFTPPAVLALVDYLRTVSVADCESPGGALFDRLKTPDAADWDVHEGWPWRHRPADGGGVVSDSPYVVPPDVQAERERQAEADRVERARKMVQERDRRELTFGDRLDAMSEVERMTLIGTARVGADGLRRDYIAKGFLNQDVRGELLMLLEIQLNDGQGRVPDG